MEKLGSLITVTDSDMEMIAMNGGCENYGGPPVPYTTASHSIQGTNAWYFVLKCQICGCGVMAVTAAGTGHR